MDVVTREWAGRERDFRLAFGQILDLEDVRDCGVGSIYLRLVGGQFYAADVWEIIRMGLIGGGLSEGKARQLVRERFDLAPMLKQTELALDILTAAMSGIETSDARSEGGDPEQPYKVSDLAHLCKALSLSTEDVRAMRYSDLVNVVKGFEAAGGKPPHITEEEFDDILARYEPVD